MSVSPVFLVSAAFFARLEKFQEALYEGEKPGATHYEDRPSNVTHKDKRDMSDAELEEHEAKVERAVRYLYG
jgi:hypothetical protein